MFIFINRNQLEGRRKRKARLTQRFIQKSIRPERNRGEAAMIRIDLIVDMRSREMTEIIKEAGTEMEVVFHSTIAYIPPKPSFAVSSGLRTVLFSLRLLY
jgi:hypothetical protein